MEGGKGTFKGWFTPYARNPEKCPEKNERFADLCVNFRDPQNSVTDRVNHRRL